MTTKLLTADALITMLIEAGIVRQDDMIRRVVIDAKVNDLVVMYVERYTDERLLNVTLTPDGVNIKREDSA